MLHCQAWHENTAKEQCLAFPRSLRRANGDYTSYRGITYIKGAEESLSSAFREKAVRARLGEEATRSLLPRRYVQPASENVTLSSAWKSEYRPVKEQTNTKVFPQGVCLTLKPNLSCLPYCL